MPGGDPNVDAQGRGGAARDSLRATGQRQMMATVDLDRGPAGWSMRRRDGIRPYESSDPDTLRIWWTDAGVHQNLTFPVHPDPISGQHCWHQAVRVRRADPDGRPGDIAVDTAKARAAYRRWLELTRPAGRVSPDRNRRPDWVLPPPERPPEGYRLPVPAESPVRA